MKQFHKALVTGMTAIGLCMASGFALAQDQSAPAAQQQATPKLEKADGAKRAKFVQRMQEKRTARQVALRDKLQLSAEQEPAWQEFVTATAPAQRAPRKVSGTREDRSKLSAPERLERRLQGMQQMQDSMARHVEAVKKFYAVLNSEQQQAFNANYRGEMQRFGQHHGPRAQHLRHGGPRPDGSRHDGSRHRGEPKPAPVTPAS